MTGQPFRLGPADAERYARLRARMLLDAPWAFAASPDDDRGSDALQVAEMMRSGEQAIIGIADDQDGELIAAAGIVRVARRKSAHRSKLWGVFVEPDHRGNGLARAVVSAAIEVAREWPGVDYVDLGVSANAPGAERLYASLGFVAWGREPESLECDGRRYDEIFMTLRL